MDIPSLLPAPSPATTAAREVVVRYSSAALVNHCDRSYLWSASLGQLKGIPYDAELLYVAAMLHDLGLVAAFDTTLRRSRMPAATLAGSSARARAGRPSDATGSRRS